MFSQQSDYSEGLSDIVWGAISPVLLDLAGGGEISVGGGRALVSWVKGLRMPTVAAKTSTQGVNRIYSARELVRRSAEPGPFHNFPEVFNKTIFQNGTKTITPNYFNVAKPGLSNTNILYRYPGTINGTKGFYEIGVRPSMAGRTEVIMHRFFNPIR